jgi:hypothetical protein
MDLDALKREWQQSSQPTPAFEENWEKAMQRHRQLHRRIVIRDWIETGAAILMFPMFFAAGLLTASKGLWVSAFGCAWLCLFLVLIPLRLRRARRLQVAPDPTLSHQDYLGAERRALQAQYDLLHSVASWYLLPLGAGVLLVFAGIMGLSLATLWYSLAVAGLYLLIWIANRVAAEKTVRPRLEDIDREIADLAEAAR